MLTLEVLIKSLYNMQKSMEENKQFLTDLDAKIGDGDHGINMNKGFQAVKKKLDEDTFESCDQVLKSVAMTLISTVGGASGPLYGTAFLKAAGGVSGKNISNEELIGSFKKAIEGIQMRGKAVKGEKTMLDALMPALEALESSIDGNKTIVEALEAAVNAAEEGVEYTKTIIASKGRASYLGERTLGHQDPGATSSYLLIKALYETLKEG